MAMQPLMYCVVRRDGTSNREYHVGLGVRSIEDVDVLLEKCNIFSTFWESHEEKKQ